MPSPSLLADAKRPTSAGSGTRRRDRPEVTPDPARADKRV
jgi:hypothetical protein